MTTTRLIQVTRTSDSVLVQIAVANIISVQPHGSGSEIQLISNPESFGKNTIIVNESPSTITTNSNANP